MQKGGGLTYFKNFLEPRCFLDLSGFKPYIKFSRISGFNS